MMPEGLLWLLAFIVLVIAYTAKRVIELNRQAKRQWDEVDKTKLKEWEDDDDW